MITEDIVPRVSVVIPTFNRAWTLDQAVDSVLAQTYPSCELIVVDDGSTDNTKELIAGYDDRIQVISTVNQGVSAARNTGIKLASGEYIALLDSDDSWTTDKVSVQMDFFRQNPDALICQTEEIWIRNGTRVNPRKKHQKPSGLIFEPSLHLCLVSPSAVMMKKELFERVGWFDEAFPVCEDYDLWLRISAEDIPIYLIDSPCTVKTGGHDDQLSKNHSQDKYRIRSITQMIGTGRLNPGYEAAARRVLREKCRIYGQGCLKRGKRDEGQFYLNMAHENEIIFPVLFP